MIETQRITAAELVVGDRIYSAAHVSNHPGHENNGWATVREIERTFDDFIKVNPGGPDQQLGKAHQIVTIAKRPDEERDAGSDK